MPRGREGSNGGLEGRREGVREEGREGGRESELRPLEAEAARQSAVVREAPPHTPLTEAEHKLDDPMSKAISALFGEHYWLAGQLLAPYKPEHGRYYDAALNLRAMVAAHMEALDEAAALYDELAARRTEFVGSVAEKKAALGKEKKK